MKKMYYVYCEDGKIEHTRYDGREQYLITISSSGDPIGTATVETGGNTLGPCDVDQHEDICALIMENLEWFEEMDEEEAKEHLENISEEWCIPMKGLEYLR